MVGTRFPLLRFLELLQVFQNKGAVCGDAPQCRAVFHLGTVGAGIQPLFPHAVVDGAELVAEGGFSPFDSAAGAVDHFRCDGYSVELCPQGGGFFPQSVIVCKSLSF